MMACSVIPLKKFEDISYSIKCVTVENEKVFGEVCVTRCNDHLDKCECVPFYRRAKRNLIHETFDGPDFMEMNKKKPSRRVSLMPPRITRKSVRRSRSIEEPSQRTALSLSYKDAALFPIKDVIKKPKVYPSPLANPPGKEEDTVTSLVDRLLLDIYGLPAGDRRRSDSDSTTSSLRPRPQHQYLQKARLLLKKKHELEVLVYNLREHITHTGGLLVRQLRRKDYLIIKRDKYCDIITAHLQAYSPKRLEDTKMRFSLSPQPGESGFIQWLDAMKMVARLQGGIPPEFRKKLWLTLAERHLEQRGVDWKQAEKVCFNEWSNPDDEELGIQIVKDLHRTGCSLFCGAAGRDNQAVLRRVLLGFARWNKSVGYCQGLNVLAALVLQVVDRAESAAVKVMIYLIEGVLPEGYFADNLRGLSIDMAVFRDLLRARLPKLSKHLEALQSDAKDKATGSSYEPPLTNVFTMQWFLTLFCHCLPQEAVLRIWDLIFLEGDEILLRTALAIWEGLSDRIMTVTSADEFYSIMGVLTREMLEFTDSNNLIKNIVSMGPLEGVTDLREKHRYNVTPWARKLSDDDDSDTEEDERLAVAAAMFSMAQRLKKERLPSTMSALQAMAPNSDRDRLALDITTLKQQYAKLRERQRQAHIILSAACARQSVVPPPASQAMNHLLVGKSALVSGKGRSLGVTGSAGASAKNRSNAIHSPRTQSRRDRQGVTLHWKDTKKPKKSLESNDVEGGPSLELPQESAGELISPRRSCVDSDSDSTSTELCDEPDRMSDVDSEDLTSASESYVIATDEEKNSSRVEGSPISEILPDPLSRETREDGPSAVAKETKKLQSPEEEKKKKEEEISIAKITDQIRRLSAEDDNNTPVLQASSHCRKDDATGKPLYEASSSIDPDAQAASTVHDYAADVIAIGQAYDFRDPDPGDFDFSSFEMRILDKKENDVAKVEECGLDEKMPVEKEEEEEDEEKEEKEEKGEKEEKEEKEEEIVDPTTKEDAEEKEEDKEEEVEERVDKNVDKEEDQGRDKEKEDQEKEEDQTQEKKEITECKSSGMEISINQDVPWAHEAKHDEVADVNKVEVKDSIEAAVKIETEEVKEEKEEDKEEEEKEKVCTDAFVVKEYVSLDLKDDKIEIQDTTDDIVANIRRGGTDTLLTHSTNPFKISYTQPTTTFPPEEANVLESTLDFSCNLSPATRRYDQTVDVDSLINRISGPPKTERIFYPTSYVGYLPISPVTVDQKLSKLGHLPYDSSSALESAQKSAPEPEVSVASTASFSDSSLIVQTQQVFATKKSPKTPESTKSFSSGETMGPDSKPSSLLASPKSPVPRSESRDFPTEKSVCSSISSDSKTLVLRSVESDSKESTHESTVTDQRKTSCEKSSPSTPISADSLRIKSETSPKLVVSSSSDSCSPSKVKSSERSFSSDLQSPVSANSIKYTSNYNKRGQDTISGSPLDLSSATSPFYPIAHPNQKTPSPYSLTKRRCSVDSVETSPEQKSTNSKDSAKYVPYSSKLEAPSTKAPEPLETDCSSRKNDLYVRPRFATNIDDISPTLTGIGSRTTTNFDLYQSSTTLGTDYYRKSKDFADDSTDDPLSEKDVVPSLPREKLDKRYLSYNYRHKDRPRQLERSSSSLERRFAELKSSISTDEFTTSIAKKRSSDILEDIKHLEAKALNEGSSDPGMLTKKTSYMWEDLKNLEARRQDTFSDSASTFSKRRLEIPDISITNEARKSYVVHPTINIDRNSDSILNTIARSKDNGAATTDDDEDDGRESKLGVWTKVKPRKTANNGRRNSDRALKIIQENSAILHRILACQAKKRLPDLEEISKEITISPINEEISKIFSPILEKMGLNEHEINEELARINLKDFDNMTATSVSEFDAKINDELSKLSLIDDNEQMDHFGVDEILSHEYLDTREALIDRKINEELSKLLAGYEGPSPAGTSNQNKLSSQTINEMECLSSISTTVFSPYKSSSDSIDTRSEYGSTHEPVIPTEKYSRFTVNDLPYKISKFQDESPPLKSDIDIYRELEKLDKISSAQVLPEPPLDLSPKELSPLQYVPNTSPYSPIPSLRYSTLKPTAYDTSPLKSSYDPYKSFDFKTRLSPRKTPSNPYTTVPYEKPLVDSTFDYLDHKPSLSSTAYDLHSKSPALTKESLEFHVKYDNESPRQSSSDFLSRPVDSLSSTITANQSSFYYGNGSTKPITPTKYTPKDEINLDTTGTSFLDYSTEKSDLLRRKYDALSPKDYSQPRSSDYDRHLGSSMLPLEPEPELGSYLPTTRHRDYHPSSPSRQYADQHFPFSMNHYATKLSPGFASDSRRPISHPEFPGKLSVGKYPDLPERGSSCYKKSSLSLGNVGHASKVGENNYSTAASPKTQFSPFPVRNAPRKPKELALKLGLYSPQGSAESPQSKRS